MLWKAGNCPGIKIEAREAGRPGILGAQGAGMGLKPGPRLSLKGLTFQSWAERTALGNPLYPLP